ncbi:MAG: hypothetical protein WBQ75_15275 [Acetobacteraceae bacterium]
MTLMAPDGSQNLYVRRFDATEVEVALDQPLIGAPPGTAATEITITRSTGAVTVLSMGPKINIDKAGGFYRMVISTEMGTCQKAKQAF